MRVNPPAMPRRNNRPRARHYRTTTQRGLGWDWQQLRRIVLERDLYLCQQCLRDTGRMVEAKDVHHKQARAVAPELRLEPDNCESLCEACHVKTRDSQAVSK